MKTKNVRSRNKIANNYRAAQKELKKGGLKFSSSLTELKKMLNKVK